MPVLPAPCPGLGEQQSLWGNLLPSPSVTVEDWERAGLPGSLGIQNLSSALGAHVRAGAGGAGGEWRGLQPASACALDPGKGLTLSVLTCRSGTLWHTSPRPVAPTTDCLAHGWGANATPGFCTGTIWGLSAWEDEQPTGPDMPLPYPSRGA